MFAEHEFYTDSDVCRKLDAGRFFCVRDVGVEHLVFVCNTFFNSSSSICVKVDLLVVEDVVVGIDRDSNEVLEISDVR